MDHPWITYYRNGRYQKSRKHAKHSNHYYDDIKIVTNKWLYIVRSNGANDGTKPISQVVLSLR